MQWSRNQGGQGGHWPPQYFKRGGLAPPIIRLDTKPLCIMYQTFFVKVWFKLLKYDLYKRIIVVTKFSNQSHTHNLYRWPLQHAIASYSTVMTTLVCYIEYHMYTVVPATAYPILLSLQVAHIIMDPSTACMNAYT